MMTTLSGVDDATWPFAGRAPELARFRRLLGDPASRGLVLAGPAGVGKTRTAQECLATVGGEVHVARAAGHQAAAEIPFGALAHLLPAPAGDAVSAREDRSRMLHRYADALTGPADGRRLVLLVDDAHLLDDSSATLVYQLATTGAAFVLVTVRAGTRAPDPVTALWKDGLTDRVELAGLPNELLEQLLGAALGGPVDPDTVLTLATRCDGNVLFLRELVLGALDDRSLRRQDGLWGLVGPLSPSDRLVELVEARLHGLSPEERALLELVSYGEPLGRAELTALGDLATAERLERRGLLSVGLRHRRLEVRLAHPVYGDVVRAGLPVLRTQTMARALAEVVEGTGARRREDILRVGGWRLAGGGGNRRLMLAAAVAARWRYDFPLAQRLVQAARDLGAGFDAALLDAKLAGIQGRSIPAEEALAALAVEASDDSERSAVAIARMDNFLYANAADDSLRVAGEAEAAITDRRWRDEITARRSTILVTTAGPRETLRAVSPLLAGTGDHALVWACLTGARSLARLGRADEALRLTERGLVAHRALLDQSERPIEWYPWFHLFNRCEALIGVGRLHEAETLARAEYRAGLTDHSPEAQACFALQLAKVALARGRARTGAETAREAVGVFRRIGRPMFLHEALHTLAGSLALGGDVAGAERELDSLSLEPAGSMYDAADLLLARGWAAAVGGNLGRARTLVGEAATLGEGCGDLVAASTALHNLARFGRPKEVGQRLDRLAERMDAGLVNPRAAHVRALAAGDARALEEASAAFADLGADLLAADAAADAAVAWTQQGNPRAAAAATRLAIKLAGGCEGARTPALRSIDARARLTPSERETAVLAAAGHSNKWIAEELVLSVRSVENRLQHVYHKLGISRRHDLREALDLTEL
jgi:DNA-binding CsgD family transcriptional regulator